MCLHRNGSGYAISLIDYFGLFGKKEASKQGYSEARRKLSWRAFEFLLNEANLEHTGLPETMKYRGHVVRAIDGTLFFTPKTEELLAHFTQKAVAVPKGQKHTHYPYGKLVTAVNVYTAQPVAAVVDDHVTSERAMVRSLIKTFSPGNISLLDRGLGGTQVFLEYEQQSQYFVNRAVTTGPGCAADIRTFLRSRKRDDCRARRQGRGERGKRDDSPSLRSRTEGQRA
jgi:hypothetical protein